MLVNQAKEPPEKPIEMGMADLDATLLSRDCTALWFVKSIGYCLMSLERSFRYDLFPMIQPTVNKHGSV